MELVLAAVAPLNSLPKRLGDGASICKLSKDNSLTGSDCILTSSTVIEDKALLLKLEDGFEKRHAVRCSRCGLMLGYQLDLAQFEESKNDLGRREDVVYVVPGGLMSTEEMEKGKKMESEVEVSVGKAG